MMKTPLTLAIAFTLACSCGLQAIGITINPNSTAASAVTLGEIHQSQVVVVAQQGVPYEFDTFASFSESFSFATWGFRNDKKQAVFYGNGLLYNQGDPVLFSTLAFAATSVKFTLTESVGYAFKAAFIGNANGNGASAEIDAQIGSSDGAGFIYAGASQTSSSAFLTLPSVGGVGFSTGMLAAGQQQL